MPRLRGVADRRRLRVGLTRQAPINDALEVMDNGIVLTCEEATFEVLDLPVVSHDLSITTCLGQLERLQS